MMRTAPDLPQNRAAETLLPRPTTAGRAGSQPRRAPGCLLQVGWGKPCSTQRPLPAPTPHLPGPVPPESSHAGAAAERPRQTKSQALRPGHLQRRIRNPKGEPLPTFLCTPLPHNRGRIQSLSLRVRPTPPLPPSGHWWNCRASSSWIGLRGRACLCSTGQTHLWILPTPAAPTHTQRQLSGHHFRNLRAVKLGMPGR